MNIVEQKRDMILRYYKPDQIEFPRKMLGAIELGLYRFAKDHTQKTGINISIKNINRFLVNASWDSLRMEAFRDHVSFLAYEESLKIEGYRYQVNTGIWEEINSKLKDPTKRYYRREIRKSNNLTDQLIRSFYYSGDGQLNQDAYADYKQRCKMGEGSLPVEALIKIIDNEHKLKGK